MGNVESENDLGKINLLEYIKTLKEHYLEMQKEISRLEKENLELRTLVNSAKPWIIFPMDKENKQRQKDWREKAEKYKQKDSE